MKKCILLFSGGLDSRLALKIMQKQDFDVIAVYFKIPFVGCSNEKSVLDFLTEQEANFRIFDCTKGELLNEYLEVIRKGKHGRGSGINPCIDCKIFMFKKAREFADSLGINLVVSGEVLGERPMSQMKKSMNLIEEESGLEGRLLRPLSAKLLGETEAEEKGLVERNKLYDIEGRQRKRQIELAEEFDIDYPEPAGGCLLCERLLRNRLKKLIDRGLNSEEVKLVNIGRHFIINNCWIVLGKDEEENNFLEKIRAGIYVSSENMGIIGPGARVIGELNDSLKKEISDLIRAYSKEGSADDKKKFEKWKL